MNENWLLIDSGGTKSHIMLTASDGEILNETVCPGIGLAVDHENEPLDDFSGVIRSLCEGVRVDRAVVNLGGKNNRQVYNVLADCVPGADIHVLRESSGVLADSMRAHFGADVIVLMGTGVIVIGRGSKGMFIADGWGVNIGDVASGYWIGLQAIQRSLAALEDPDAWTPLAAEVTGHSAPFAAADTGDVQMQLRDQARAHIGLPLDRARVAALTKKVRQFAESGDPMALSILNDAGTGMANTVARTLKACGREEAPRVLVIGGVAGLSHLWGDAFDQRLKSLFPQAEWEARQCDILEGCKAYAQNLMNRRKNI